MTKINETKITDIIQDDRNLNRGTDDGKEMISKSLRKFGAGRSILIDKNNRIIAGNKTHENAREIGIDDVVVVETDGSKLVAVKRTDIDLDTTAGREMALADNATVKADLQWDMDEMDAIATDFDIEVEDWGIELDEMPSEGELTEDAQDLKYQVRMCFYSEKDVHDFCAKYEKQINQEFKVKISVSNGHI